MGCAGSVYDSKEGVIPPRTGQALACKYYPAHDMTHFYMGDHNDREEGWLFEGNRCLDPKDGAAVTIAR